MIRLCVIGNSHLAAYKLGWDMLRDDPGFAAVRPVFFGAPRDGMRRVRLDNGVVTPLRKDILDHFRRMSGGLGEIRLSDYDAVLLVGLGASIKRVMRFYRGHAWFGLAGTGARTLVPVRFATEFLTESYATTRLVELAARLRGATGVPILAVAEPFWAASVRGGSDKPDYGWNTAIKAGDGDKVAEMFRATLGAALAPHARLVPQPPRTVADAILTQDIYNTRAPRQITGESDDSDEVHMNGAFGAEMWTEIRQALAGAATCVEFQGTNP